MQAATACDWKNEERDIVGNGKLIIGLKFDMSGNLKWIWG